MTFALGFDAADADTRGLLLAAAIVWLFAAWFAAASERGSPHRASFWSFFAASMAANGGVLFAQTIATFYLFYAVLTFTSYGLVLATRTDEARRAGRIYLVMALGGEVLLLGAFWLVAGERIDLPLAEVPLAVAHAPHRSLVVALILAGFGVKAGAVPLHLWLPLAHPVAPAPASAALSGAIINAGLVGWLRFLPIGAVALPGFAAFCSAAGLLTAFYGALVGALQREPKTALAYSSVSQMGLALTAIGAALASPAAAAATRSAIVLFVLHHAIAKASLFIGVAVAKHTGSGWPRRLVALGLALPCLAIAGAPLTSGALAKLGLGRAIASSFEGSAPLGIALSTAAVGSTLVMLRFFTLAVPLASAPRAVPRLGLWMPWALLVCLTMLPFAQASRIGVDVADLVRPGKLWSGAWPVATGVALAVAARAARRHGVRLPRIPPGDILVLLGPGSARLRRLVPSVRPRRPVIDRRRSLVAALTMLQDIEVRLRRFTLIGALVLLLVILFVPFFWR